MPQNRAIFLDRDGVFIEDTHLPSKWEDIKIREEIIPFMVWAKEKKFKLIMVTNQTVVARGILTLEQAYSLNEKILREIYMANPLATLDKVYLCPHHPNASVKEYRQECPYRKPRSQSFLDAKDKFNLDLNKCLMVGDRVSDIVAGNTVTAKTFLLQSGRHEEKMIESSAQFDEAQKKPDFIIQSLKEISDLFEQGKI